ncbi:MAG: hypothetical protein ACRD5H_01100 [Nitrososphaerales archaeon]
MPKLFAPDAGLLGLFSLGVSSGNIAATLAANAPLFSMHWSQASHLFVPDIIKVGVSVSGVITTSVTFALELVIARSFTVADSGGTAITLTSDNNTFRTAFDASLMADARIASTGTLTAGTRTLDSQAFTTVPLATGTAIGVPLALATIYDRTDLFPIILAQNEGFIIRNNATGPATGTFVLHVYMRWLETVREILV